MNTRKRHNHYLTLKQKAALQRGHAFSRARQRYGLYLDDVLYAQLLVQIRQGLEQMCTGRPNGVFKYLCSQEDGIVNIVKVYFLDEWMLIAYDTQTGEIRTFLPPTNQHVKGVDISAA
jgi:hypothetical protein